MIDVDKPLYDSDGYELHLVAYNSMEVVTKICGVFAVWNRRTGECLRIGSGGVLLGNAPLSFEVKTSLEQQLVAKRRQVTQLREVLEGCLAMFDRESGSSELNRRLTVKDINDVLEATRD